MERLLGASLFRMSDESDRLCNVVDLFFRRMWLFGSIRVTAFFPGISFGSTIVKSSHRKRPIEPDFS